MFCLLWSVDPSNFFFFFFILLYICLRLYFSTSQFAKNSEYSVGFDLQLKFVKSYHLPDTVWSTFIYRSMNSSKHSWVSINIIWIYYS